MESDSKAAPAETVAVSDTQLTAGEALARIVAKVEERKAKDKARVVGILKALAEPFDESDISWKPQIVKNGRAMVIAYGDPRAYYDRLNNVLGADGWRCKFDVQSVAFTGNKHVGKMIAVATLTINGIGEHSSTGEAWLEDDNAATGAEAQALKRACVPFGLGEYLYHLPKIWVDYDEEKKRFIEGKEPKMPGWALPKRICEQCGKEITAYTMRGGDEMSVTAIIARSKKEYNGVFCANCCIIKHSEKMTGVRMDQDV